MKSRFAMLALLALVSANASATVFNASLDSFGGPTLDIRNPGDGSVIYSGAISGGAIGYDSVTGDGSFDLSANLTSLAATSLHDTAVTTNSNGSLHFEGLVDFGGLGTTNNHFLGDLEVGYNYDAISDVAQFTYSPISAFGTGVPGFLIQDGPMAGALMDFNASSSFLAFVENPFPSYSPVPVPAAVWLFGSGLIGLFGLAGKRTA